MRVCEVTEFGGPEVLRESERPWPVPGPGEVVVSIEATAVNPTDIAARSGAHARRLPDLLPPFILGWDIAGTVADAGDGSSGLSVGEPVVGMIPWLQTGGRTGAYAQAAAVQPAWLAPRPAGLDATVAATIPLNALTARQGLDLIAAPPGARILITGASGAVGGYATQLAALDGLEVVAMASAGDEAWVLSLGASGVIGRDADLGAIGTFDAVFDAVPIGATTTAGVRPGGGAMFTRRVTGAPESLRVFTPLVEPDADALATLTAMVAQRRLRTRVSQVLDLGQGAEAHRLAEGGGLRGKVVLRTG
jgi:NADPH:quinone reductase